MPVARAAVAAVPQPLPEPPVRDLHGGDAACGIAIRADESLNRLSTIISDAAVQYIAGIIDEDGLRAAWQQWYDEGGALIIEEYNAAYQAAQK